MKTHQQFQTTTRRRRAYAISVLAFGFVASGACSSTTDDDVLPIGTVVDECPQGHTCETNDDGQLVVSGHTDPGSGGSGTDGGVVGTGGTSGGTSNNATGGASTTTGGNGSGGTNTTCTDIKPDDRDISCATWAEWGECDNSNGWLDNYCDLSCGRCTASGSGGSTGSTGGGGSTGSGNPWGGVTNGQSGYSTRYWDCCKPHCAWNANSGNNPVNSCDSRGENPSNNQTGSVCSGGSSAVCNNQAPWAYSNEVALGFAAVPFSGDICGKCYKLQFTGTGHWNPNDPGSNAIAGKVMIVMATNTGDIGTPGHFDLMIPGGGQGSNYGCEPVWGVPNGHQDLGAVQGGLLATCGEGSLQQKKDCVAGKCQQLFGSRGLTSMYDACMWFVNWFQVADNPDFSYQEISCPSELTNIAY